MKKRFGKAVLLLASMAKAVLLLASMAAVSGGCQSGMEYHQREVNVWRWNHEKGARELVRSDLIQTGTGRSRGHPMPAPIPRGWIEPSGAR